MKTSLNFILTNGENLFALRKAFWNINHYSLYYLCLDPNKVEISDFKSEETRQLIKSKRLRGKKLVLICSEKLTNEENWKELANKYIAHKGFHLIIDNKFFELIELDDFNFQFETKEDMENVINILQILDSESYKLITYEKFISGFSPYLISFLNKLMKKKYIKKGEEEYKYLDTEDFTIWNRLPENYPNKTERLLQEFGY